MITHFMAYLGQPLNPSRASGVNVVGYGAAAKATVLLNYFGINNDDLMFVADQNLLKQNNWIPGVAIPIVSPAVISDEGPAIVLILAWNLVDEVFQQLKTLNGERCEFIVPVPTPCRLNANGEQMPL